MRGIVYFKDGHTEDIIVYMPISSDNIRFVTISGFYEYREEYSLEVADIFSPHIFIEMPGRGFYKYHEEFLKPMIYQSGIIYNYSDAFQVDTNIEKVEVFLNKD